MKGDERELIHAIMDDLKLPPERYLLGGSAAMVLSGLERKKKMGDLDIFCDTEFWFKLRNDLAWTVWTPDPMDPASRCDPPYLVRHKYTLEVNAFFNWRRRGVGDIDLNFWMANKVEIDGLPCVPLQLLLDVKRSWGRAKDVDDILILEHHLGEGA
jgi:hypothetical protein